MPSRFHTINELDGKSHRTSAISRSDIYRVAVAAVYILTHYVDGDNWKPAIVRKGSLTLQHKSDPHQVIKIFVDYGAAMWDSLGFGMAHPSVDPVAIGIELTALGPFEREVVRDALTNEFRFYADPRKLPFSKRWLKPIEDHKYDVLFLEPGRCEDFDTEALGLLVGRLEEELPVASEDEI